MKLKLALMLIVLGFVSNDARADSIQELIVQDRIPKIRGIFAKRLNLSGLGIDSLEGLDKIKGIETVQILLLGNNKIKTIPAKSFTAAKNLRALGLQNNDLTTIEQGAFEGLSKLWVLVLNANNVSSVPQEGLTGLPKLKLLSLGNNPIAADRVPALKRQVPTAHMFFLPITRANLKRAGAVVAGVATLALVVGKAAYGTRELSKKEQYEETLWPHERGEDFLKLPEDRQSLIEGLVSERIKENPALVQNLNDGEIKFLLREQIQAIDLKKVFLDQIQALTPTQITWLTDDQATLMNEMGGQRLGLNPAQLNALYQHKGVRHPESGFGSEFFEEARPRSISVRPLPESEEEEQTMKVSEEKSFGLGDVLKQLQEVEDPVIAQKLSQMSREDLRDLGDDIILFPPNLIPALDKRITGLTSAQIGSLTNNQLSMLTKNQVEALMGESPEKVHALRVMDLSQAALSGFEVNPEKLTIAQRRALLERKNSKNYGKGFKKSSSTSSLH